METIIKTIDTQINLDDSVFILGNIKRGQIIINDNGIASQFIIYESYHIDDSMFSIFRNNNSRNNKPEYYINYYMFPDKDIKTKYGSLAGLYTYIFDKNKNISPDSKYLNYINLIEQIDKL